MISASLAIRVHFELRIVILMIAFPMYVMAVTKVAIPTFSFQFMWAARCDTIIWAAGVVVSPAARWLNAKHVAQAG
jgi:NADH dehydrogenase FAD-containing subunit